MIIVRVVSRSQEDIKVIMCKAPRPKLGNTYYDQSLKNWEKFELFWPTLKELKDLWLSENFEDVVELKVFIDDSVRIMYNFSLESERYHVLKIYIQDLCYRRDFY